MKILEQSFISELNKKKKKKKKKKRKRKEKEKACQNFAKVLVLTKGPKIVTLQADNVVTVKILLALV